MKTILYFLLFFSYVIQLFPQIGSTIPVERRVDWSTAGYQQNPQDNLPKYDNCINVARPDSNPNVNYQNIIKKINEAKTLSGFTAVILQEGVYKINKTISLSPSSSNIIIKGQGSDKTTLLYDSDSESAGIYILRAEGNLSKINKKYFIDSFDTKSKTITLKNRIKNLKAEYYLDIRVPNGSWDNSQNRNRWSPEDYFGQIVKITAISDSNEKITLQDDLSLVWSVANAENLNPYVQVFLPVQQIGIEDIKLVAGENNNGLGSNIIFKYAANCWVKNIESENPPQVHIMVDRSSAIEVRNSYIHHAQDYGNIAGAGYGIHVHSRSTNCVIVNNIFEHLRHSMMVSLGANRNVFGFNFSTDQYSSPVKNLADLNVHGYYAFANLFEGNIVERIKADNYWGSNGPFNTFVRNHITKDYFKLESCDYSNLLMNDYDVFTENSKFIFDKYKNPESFSDTSYYCKQKPKFLKDYDWPLSIKSMKNREKDFLFLIKNLIHKN